MANQSSSATVKVPATATSYTAATLDPDLRSQINAVLIRDGHVTSIQDQLLHSLHSNQANWPTIIQNHALNLLRSGEVTTFPALVRRVMEDIRQDIANKSSTTNGEVNGSKKANGTASSENGGGGATGQLQRRQTMNEAPSLAIPQAVLEDALKVTREALEMVIGGAACGKGMLTKDDLVVDETQHESSGEWSVLLRAEQTDGEEESESDTEVEVIWVTDSESESGVSGEEDGSGTSEKAAVKSFVSRVNCEAATQEAGMFEVPAEQEDEDADDEAEGEDASSTGAEDGAKKDSEDCSDEYIPGVSGSDNDDWTG